MLRLGAEAHDALHAGAVVPRAVEEDDLSGRWEVLDVALEVPGGGFTRGGLFQRDDAGTTGVEVLVEAFDGAALAGGVASFEKDDVALACGLGPVLPLEELDLQGALDVLVLGAFHLLVVRVVFAPRVYALAIGFDQHRIVLVAVIDVVSVQFS